MSVPSQFGGENSCDLREGPLADHDRVNFAEGGKISALAFGCAAVISAAASGVARTVARDVRRAKMAEEGI